MGLNRNINDDSTLAYLFNKTRQGASDALQKAIDAINATIASIQTALNNKVDKSGDTMSGDLVLKHPGNTTDQKAVNFHEGSGSLLGFVRHSITSAGASVVDVVARKYVNGASVFNGVTMTVNADGTRAVTFNDPAPWRTALNAVNKAGDTMTGNLTIVNGDPRLFLKNSDIDTTAATLSADKSITIPQYDKNNRYAAYWQSSMNTNGTVATTLAARRVVNNANVNNSLTFYVAANGTKSVYLSDQAAWRTALGLGSIATVASPVPIANGGTGQTAVTKVTTISTIATAGANITIQSCEFTYWGKVAQFNIVIKANAAIASAATVFTLKSGYRPAADANGTFADARWMTIGTNGTVHPQSAISSGSTYAFRAFYLLA